MLIGLHGLPRCGKDTIADYLVDVYGFRKISFAQALYAEVAKSFRVTVEQLQSHEWKTVPQAQLAINCSDDALFQFEMAHYVVSGQIYAKRTSREILQFWGTEYRRRVTQNYWLSKFERNRSLHAGNVVAPDVRFDNEAAIIRRENGKILHITRPGCLRSNHESDKLLSEEFLERSMANDGTLEMLYQKIDFYMKGIKWNR